MEPRLDLDQASTAIPCWRSSRFSQGDIVQNCARWLRAWKPGCPAAVTREPGCQATHRHARGLRRGRGKQSSPAGSVNRALPGWRMEPTAQVTLAPGLCSEWRTARSGGSVQRTRDVIEPPVCPAEVTEHVFIAQRCPKCVLTLKHEAQDPIREAAVTGRQRLGIILCQPDCGPAGAKAGCP